MKSSFWFHANYKEGMWAVWTFMNDGYWNTADFLVYFCRVPNREVNASDSLGLRSVDCMLQVERGRFA